MSIDDEVLTRARAGLACELGISPDEIEDDTDLYADLGVDSLDWLRLIYVIEQEFSVVVPEGVEIQDFRFRAAVKELLAHSTPS